jgi:hypothetical protein
MAAGRMQLGKIDAALLVSGCAAAVFAVAAIAAEPGGKLEDVQIGERGDILRVALICTTRCDITPGAGVDFRINGVAADLEIDLSARSALARRLTISAAEGSSVVRIDAAARVNEARVITCQSDTGAAPCIEFRFEPGERTAHPAGPASAKKPSPKPAIRDKGDAKSEAHAPGGEKDLPFIGAIILAPGPVLRDEPAAGVLYLPQFAPPERLAPPSEAQDPPGEEVSGLPANVGVARPSLISVDRAAALGAGASFDIKRETAEILGKSLDVGVCEGARARLQGDAWALDSMIDLAYCKAADGKLEEADADFARLLAYTPDNYEALVGRGLIAIASGEREKGLAFYQDALNALPPIDESDRIVEAMKRS